MAERRGPLGHAILKMTYRIQAFVSVVWRVQLLLELIEHEEARRLATSGMPIPGLRPTCLPQHRQKTEVLLRHLQGSSEIARPVGMIGSQSPASPLTRISSISDISDNEYIRPWSCQYVRRLALRPILVHFQLKR
jgi:hypothetical protein